MNISMHKTAKSLELVEVEVYGCYILCTYLIMRKTLIMVGFLNSKIKKVNKYKYKNVSK